MSKSKRNPQLCTTEVSLLKGKDSIFRISGVFVGKSRVCYIEKSNFGFKVTTVTGKVETKTIKLEDVQSGKINIVCIERGE